MKKTLLAGTSALALVLGLSAGAWAHDIDISGNIIDDVIGHDAFDSHNNVSTNVLAQIVSAVTDEDPIVQAHEKFEGAIKLKDHSFTHALGVFNVGFNTGTNAAQAGQIAISATANIGVPGED